MEEKEIINKLLEIAREGRITCQAARELAEELELPYSTIGKACNEAQIKISACVLGCF